MLLTSVFQANDYYFFITLVFLSTIPTIIFFFYFLKKTFQMKQRMFRFLAILFGVYLIQHFFSICQLIVMDEGLAQGAFTLSEILGEVILFLLIIVLEMFEKNSPYSGRVTIFTVPMAATIGAALSGPNILYDQLAHGYFFYYDTSDLTLRYLQVTFGLLAALWFVITLIRSWRAAKSPVQKRLIILLVTGMFLSQIVGVGLSGLLEVGGKLQLSSRYTLFSLTGIQFTQDIGMFLIGLGFFRISKHPWLLQRQSVQLLVVYNKDGVIFFPKDLSLILPKMMLRCSLAHFPQFHPCFKKRQKYLVQPNILAFKEEKSGSLTGKILPVH